VSDKEAAPQELALLGTRPTEKGHHCGHEKSSAPAHPHREAENRPLRRRPCVQALRPAFKGHVLIPAMATKRIKALAFVLLVGFAAPSGPVF
jgi:hypothetical protein